jgi:hypothetical protein
MPVPTNIGLMPNSDANSMLNNMEQVNSLLAATGTNLPMDWATMSIADKQKFLTSLTDQANKADTVTDVIDKNLHQQQENLDQLQNAGITAKRSIFNLHMAQMQSQNIEDNSQMTQFSDGSEVKNWLDQLGDPNVAIKLLSNFLNSDNQIVLDETTNQQGEALGIIKDTVSEFYSSDDQQVKLKAASLIFDTIMPEGAKSNNDMNNTNIPAHFEQIAKSTTEQIKKMAFAHESKEKKTVFNLKKHAQHKSLENALMFGPNNHIDQFTGQLINDWHLVERNKGFGLKLPGVYNIDWETIWRSTIMDKYTEATRNAKGEWVGGYIQDRFEVDKNIPKSNNLQLPPGVKSRPVLPEYGNIGTRLENVRNKDDKAGSDPTKFFNLKKAKSQSNLKTAQVSVVPQNPGNMQIKLQEYVSGWPDDKKKAFRIAFDSGVLTTCDQCTEDLNDDVKELVKQNGSDREELFAKINDIISAVLDNASEQPTDIKLSHQPFNLSKFAKKKIKTSQLKPIGNLPNEGMKLPGDDKPGSAANPKCKGCGGNLSKSDGGFFCQNCGNMGTPNMTPAYEQTQPAEQVQVQKNQLLASGIFYDRGHFVVFSSDGGKKEFETFNEAEKFAQAIVPPIKRALPYVPKDVAQKNKKLTKQPVPSNSKDIETARSADMLGIDG